MAEAVVAKEKLDERKNFIMRSAKNRIMDIVQDPQFADRLCRVALVAHVEQPLLLECTPASIVKSLMQAAEVGLEVGSGRKHASLIPRWSKDKEAYEAHFDPEYRGLQHLAMRSGLYHAIKAEVVYEHDEFDWQEGADPDIRHKPTLGDRGEMIAAYAIAWPKSGGPPIQRVLPKHEIERIRNHSQAFKKNSGPWITDPAPMWKKTAIKQLCDKDLESTPELAEVIAIDDAVESGDERLLAAMEARYGDPAKALVERTDSGPSKAERVSEKLRREDAEAAEKERKAELDAAVEQLQSLMEKCAKLGVLDPDDAEEMELAIHDEDHEAVRGYIKDLQKALIEED